MRITRNDALITMLIIGAFLLACALSDLISRHIDSSDVGLIWIVDWSWSMRDDCHINWEVKLKNGGQKIKFAKKVNMVFFNKFGQRIKSYEIELCPMVEIPSDETVTIRNFEIYECTKPVPSSGEIWVFDNKENLIDLVLSGK